MSRTGNRQEPTPSDDGEGNSELVDGGPFPVGATEIADFPDVGENALAPIFPRAMARLTDFVVSVMVPSAVVAIGFGSTVETDTGEEMQGIPVWTLPVLVIALAVYEIGVVAWRGGTLGMLIGRLTLKTLDSGEPPTLNVAIRRAALPLVAYAVSLVLPVAFIAYLAIYLSPILDQKLRQGWYDKAAKTVVVRTR